MNADPAGAEYGGFRKRISEILDGRDSPYRKLQAVCDHLVKDMEHCDWAGFYLVDPSGGRQLILGPFAGAPTEHTRIAFGEGICGQAASTEKTFVIADVSMETNYLSCSPDVKSEIVVPVFHRGEIVGEIDLDSHTKCGFGEGEMMYLEWLADRTGGLVETVRNSEG